jgi:hypothetical protein
MADIKRDSLMLFLSRYELQADDSLLDEYQFTYDARWFKDQIQEVLSFWQGSREPKFVTEEDRWKCSFCKFASKCPMIASTLTKKMLRFDWSLVKYLTELKNQNSVDEFEYLKCLTFILLFVLFFFLDKEM